MGQSNQNKISQSNSNPSHNPERQHCVLHLFILCPGIRDILDSYLPNPSITRLMSRLAFLHVFDRQIGYLRLLVEMFTSTFKSIK